jgi:hypothetical protein
VPRQTDRLTGDASCASRVSIVVSLPDRDLESAPVKTTQVIGSVLFREPQVRLTAHVKGTPVSYSKLVIVQRPSLKCDRRSLLFADCSQSLMRWKNLRSKSAA